MVLCFIASDKEDLKVSPGDIKDFTEVLKEGQIFVTSLPTGEIPCKDIGGLGMYYQDTRFLSCLELLVEDQLPVFLSETTRESHFAQIELTNSEFDKDGFTVPFQTIHLRILRVVKDAFYQRIRLINFNSWPVKLRLKMNVGADFLDIFEVRGFEREKRGQILPAKLLKNGFLFSYEGLDGIKRYAKVQFTPKPINMEIKEEKSTAEFVLELPPKKKVYLYTRILPYLEGKNRKRAYKENHNIAADFSKTALSQAESYNLWKKECADFHTDNALFNRLLTHGLTDLRALSTEYPGWGTIIEAGIPWYTAPFGRDSLITSWQTLLVNPNIARETIRFLAKFQGREVNHWRDEEPGKILHELRRGEMASCGEVPHTPYYGSADSTLLFIILLAETYFWTGDRQFLLDLEGALNKALLWCEKYGDLDGDGFIEYQRKSEKGLTNQGWKDSWDGVIDVDGSIPEGPIALVEVQAYYYLALLKAAELYRILGQSEKSTALEQRAYILQKKFLEAFWKEDINFLAFALDGNKKPLKTIVSNPGHSLFTGILPTEKAVQVVRRLFKDDMYSGWGIRTMSKLELAYNPMSYHNGSIWPHDNALIAAGLRKLEFFELLERVTIGLYQAALHFPYYRLPELFCGFTRRGTAGPVKYPIACDPQAWAVGTMFHLLQIMLGISCRGNELHISKPNLPEFINELELKNLAVGNGRVDLEFSRGKQKTFCNVLNSMGKVRVIFEP